MKTYFKYPLFLILLPLFFFLFGYTDHGKFLHLHKLLYPYSLIYFLIITGYWLLNKATKHRLKNALFVFYIATVYLFFGNIKGRVDSLTATGAYTLLIVVLIAIPIILHILIKKYPKLERQFFSYCNTLMVSLCAIQCILLSLKYTKNDKHLLTRIEGQSLSRIQTPSIHLILLDGYPGFNSLNNYFKFTNADIKNYFFENNYFVLDSICSNYFQTYFSMNSILNMQYLSYLHKVPLNKYNNVLEQLQQINENQLVHFLLKNKYSIHNNSIFEINNQSVLNNNSKFKSSEQIHFNEILHNRLIKDFLWKFAKGNFKFKIAEDKIVLNQFNQNNSTINNLLSLKTAAPHFTYSHIIMPHEPYYTDSAGNFLDRVKASKLNNEILFVNYIKYTNKKIKEIVAHLSATEPNAIVIIMSDHGYREYTNPADLPMKFNNLMAVHFPDSNYLNISKLKSNVNLFRIILNQYFNQKLPILDDSCINIDEEKNSVKSTKL